MRRPTRSGPGFGTRWRCSTGSTASTAARWWAPPARSRWATSPITEEIVTVDDDLRRFQYSITEMPIPVEYHLSTIDVLEDGDGTLIVYGVDVQPDMLEGHPRPHDRRRGRGDEEALRGLTQHVLEPGGLAAADVLGLGLAGPDPRHHRAQLRADGLDRVLRATPRAAGRSSGGRPRSRRSTPWRTRRSGSRRGSCASRPWSDDVDDARRRGSCRRTRRCPRSSSACSRCRPRR